ncbi:PDZ domain-containing protein [Aquibacillus rhizosphaerae]|uniref:PDZ domain-containing protein n=1 Tax=Aquibacillus rhizosphaerae TaxID=3051431 RepID=A0ABT7L0B2_9BACI|nr:PDZ domain-containing protein [Aquibacillus sp. LR5S19]MDL4839261.1 PDZ domain-containing protein [Aquibacillus sp. LR5S19]
MDDWLIELAKGLGRLFLSPLFYWFFILTFLASAARIKKERTHFGSKIFDTFYEAKHTWFIALISGILLSVLAIGVGVLFSYPVILLLSFVTILFSITRKFSLLSSAYVFGFTYIMLLILPTYLADYIPDYWLEQLQQLDLVSFTTLLGLFLVIEAIIMMRIDQNNTLPELIKGKRGKWLGQHRIKKIAMIPLFTLIPDGTIVSFADWWPVFHVNGESYGLMLFPVIIGFEHVIRGSLPIKAIRSLSHWILILGLVTIGISIAGYYLPLLTLVSVAIAIIGREFISYRFRLKDQLKKPFFSPESAGVLVLGVIPGTPAESIDLLVGERIMKVNGKPVSSEDEFYQALQANSAYCKLDIRDVRGELRFAQRALYQGEHHELGILFAKEHYLKKEKKSKKID